MKKRLTEEEKRLSAIRAVKKFQEKLKKENPNEFKKRRYESYLRWKKKLGKEKYSTLRKKQTEKWKNKDPERAKSVRKKAYGKFLSLKKDQYLKSIRVNRKKRMENDLNYKIKVRLRGALGQALRTRSSYKKSGTRNLLGCEYDFLRKHLEKQFKPGMTWDNWGKYKKGSEKKWHVDHIIPTDAWDLTKIEDQKMCFHYTNLQPMWWDENIKKGNKW